MGRVVALVFAAFLCCVMAAIAVQQFGAAVPEGLFNNGRRVAMAISAAAFAACAIGLAVVLGEIRRGRATAAGRWVRVAVSFVVVLELLVTAADLTVMSRSASAPLGGPYYEIGGEGGEPVILRKRGGVPPFGFRAAAPYEKTTGAFRVLFLGDSYTEGSGRQRECNYPTVVEGELAARMDRAVEVMNAGVSGYGPLQSLALLRELDARGYRYDAIVYNVFVENDFTDNLPGTERRVVAGMAFRFPQSWFLRTFHPVNTRTFRTASFIRGLIRVRYELHDMAVIPDEPCDLAPQELDSVPETVRHMVTRKLGDMARAAAAPALQRSALEPIEAMRDRALAAGVPFVVVVFPDRASGDPDIRRLLSLDGHALEPSQSLRGLVVDALPATPVLDVTGVLAWRPGLYRSVDTHLNDLGNVTVGTRVGEQLARIFTGD